MTKVYHERLEDAIQDWCEAQDLDLDVLVSSPRCSKDLTRLLVTLHTSPLKPTYRQIAEAIGISKVIVERRIQRAQKKKNASHPTLAISE